MESRYKCCHLSGKAEEGGEVVLEEELSRTVMVFGLPEEDSEQLERSVREVFQQLGEAKL